jgi:DtxR family Mn-dependent transcriptional regulator
MEHQNFLQPISESEQMYLLKTLQLAQSGADAPVPVAALAQALEVQPVSANQMVHSLQAAGLLEYLPYKGVQLTPAGAQQAARVLRYRRLWQAFLHEQLGLDPQAAEDIACQFEHATSEEAADRLEAYLDRAAAAPAVLSLADLTPGQAARIQSIGGPLADELEFLDLGLQPGQPVNVLLRGAQGDVLLQTSAGTLHLSADTAAAIQVTLAADQEADP